ncbi:hypothetical protein B0I35DRAFT_426067 [Stachybotrys elegans]|uniref:Nucleoside phosphorylase domain-containing protein n=1 Tax=Stachybotrys elegans TaxID=80388 RepID=A0A8K0WUH9_9HYPO|nr:hypothetical protein B0I35DRAFT_426067 [Stachybotrys elegans]
MCCSNVCVHNKMPYLVESNEWRLLQRIGRLLNQRKAPFRAPPHEHRGGRLNAELLEVELREVFVTREYPQDLPLKDFEDYQATLISLCSILDGLVCFRKTGRTILGKTYPQLSALAEHLESTTSILDLIDGPNETVFRLPQDPAELRQCLDVATKCNTGLPRLLEPMPHEPAKPPISFQRSKTAWKKARIRNRATVVLGRLFGHFKCQQPHEVLLKLVEDPDEHSSLPDLHLMLPSCHELEIWQEARCECTDLDGAISSIPDICSHVREHTGQGKKLMLLIKEYGLFGAWGGNASTGPDHSRQSLGQLITKGAFKPLDLVTLFHGASLAQFSIGDKRALAVKLGFCLLDFFDVDIASNKIYFLGSSNSVPNNDFPYLAFSSRLPATAQSFTNFELGHPVLLSFAKLLLEIDFGQTIDLEIKPQNSQNRGVWIDLLSRVDRLAKERFDSYLQAIRGCLVVHEKITKALQRHQARGKSTPDSIVRKKIYQEVISKLERGLEESIPRPISKRQRSESPTPSGDWGATQSGAHEEITARPSLSNHGSSDSKRRRFLTPGTPAMSDSSREDLYARSPPPDGCATSNSGSRYNGWSRHSTHHQANSSDFGSSQPSTKRPSRREEFEIGIICALPLESDAVSYLFDKFWDEDGDQYGRAPGDTNHYTTGCIGHYNVVLALLPCMGKTNAASAAASLRSSYSNLKLVLLVGICGVAPYHRQEEVLLGDVIVSKTVIQYDFGRQYPDKFVRKETTDANLGRANKDVRNLVGFFETDRGIDWLEARTAFFIQQLQDKLASTKRRGKYDHPGVDKDKLYNAEYRHKHHLSRPCICRDCTADDHPVCTMAPELSCAVLGCDDAQLISRDRIRATKRLEASHTAGGALAMPRVHVGPIACGDSVIKSAAHRDRISRENDVIAFEMEGAGVWDEVPCIVIKGACDYADSHKNKDWQNYAAATAASACKAMLERYIQTARHVDESFAGR